MSSASGDDGGLFGVVKASINKDFMWLYESIIELRVLLRTLGQRSPNSHLREVFLIQ